MLWTEALNQRVVPLRNIFFALLVILSVFLPHVSRAAEIGLDVTIKNTSGQAVILFAGTPNGVSLTVGQTKTTTIRATPGQTLTFTAKVASSIATANPIEVPVSPSSHTVPQTTPRPPLTITIGPTTASNEGGNPSGAARPSADNGTANAGNDDATDKGSLLPGCFGVGASQTYTSVKECIKDVGNLAIQLVLAIALIALMVTGYLFATSLGNKQQAEQAKNSLLFIVIGILVVLGAYLTVDTVSRYFLNEEGDQTAPPASTTPAPKPDVF